jgi:hypothetical protein
MVSEAWGVEAQGVTPQSLAIGPHLPKDRKLRKVVTRIGARLKSESE